MKPHPIRTIVRRQALLVSTMAGLVAAALLCGPPGLVGQSSQNTLSGVVVDPAGLAIPGAEVRVLGANRVLLARSATDSTGGFLLEALPRGYHQLVVEAAGFSPARRVLSIPAEEPIKVRLEVSPVETRVTVTAQHGAPEEILYEVASVEVRDSEELAVREVSHLPRQLAEQPGVLLQETTPGQGSPILRGQGAQTVLYLLDGIRFNNSTYRSGNTQYLGWVPATATDAVEVFLGPAGTQYGSDALGGAVNVLTRDLPSWNEAGWHSGGESRTFFQSANLQGGAAMEASVAGPRLTFSLGGVFSRSQDLRAGGGFDSHNALTRFLGLSPSVVRDILGSRLRDTAYSQGGMNAKLSLRFDSDRFLTFSWLQSEQWGVRRYDRLLGGEGRFRSDFLPQRLRFGYVRYQKVSAGPLRSVAATFSLNQQVDGQVAQTRETSTLRNERNQVTALGYTLSTAWQPNSRHTVSAGAEFYDEFVSTHRLETGGSGATVSVRPRYPDGARYQSLGLYLTDDWKPFSNQMTVDGGLRFSHFRFRTRAADNIFNGIATVPDAKETFTDLTFHAGIAYPLTSNLVAVGRIARGFRAPTVFDLGELGITGGGFEVSPGEAIRLGARIGDSAGSNALSTGRTWQPLDPEVLWSFETGLRWRTRKLNGGITFFDSEFFDSIQRRVVILPGPTTGQTIGGETITSQDSAGRVFVALDSRPVVSRANIGRVRIYGAEASTRVHWTGQWSSALKASTQRGKELDTGNFARRIAPDFYFFSLRWDDRDGRLWLEFFSELSADHARLNPAELNDPRVGAFRTPETITDFFHNGASRLGLVENDLLSLTGESSDQVVTRVLGPDSAGAPLFDRTGSFATLNVRGSYRVSETGELFFALTNLTDENYRRHGSGFDAPGINLSLSYRIFLP